MSTSPDPDGALVELQGHRVAIIAIAVAIAVATGVEAPAASVVLPDPALNRAPWDSHPAFWAFPTLT